MPIKRKKLKERVTERKIRKYGAHYFVKTKNWYADTMTRTADTFISEFEKEEGLWNVKSEI